MKKLFKRLKENKKGFSLVELIVVIAIMAILVGVLGVTFIPYIERSREGMDIDTLGKVKSVVEPVMLTDENLKTYAGENGTAYPLTVIDDVSNLISEGLTETVSADCTCSDETLVCYVLVLPNGTVTAYFSNDDGASAYGSDDDETKSGDVLTTAALPTTFTVADALPTITP